MARCAIDRETSGPTRLGRLARIGATLALAIVAVVAGGLVLETCRARRQRDAIDAVWALGGYAERRDDRQEERASPLRCLRRLLGDDFRNPVVLVRLARTRASDDDLIAIGGLTHLRMLDLGDTRVTDEGLRHLAGLEHLEVLVLSGTAITDRGLAHLAGMSRLKVLCLEETRIGDEGLAQLKRFPRLGWLNLSGARVTGAGLRHLWDCPALEVLILDPWPAGDEAVLGRHGAAAHVEIYDGTRRRPSFHAFHEKRFAG
ncbi:MAG: hypothetical protein NUV77_10660 [Thermoguttaceae bacterium]|jgi:hypothetical protein|nr:hypothetical protein [Thermoguttaceae bacterium]